MTDPAAEQVREITPQEARDLLKTDDNVILLDVREPEEIALAAIPGSLNIPVGEIPARLYELQQHDEATILTLCHVGFRSLNVAHFLAQHGFEDLASIAGGIDAWSRTVDPTIPRY
ncbi:MAG: rhodanese-like domain-containing protein [Phycisphaeraceae bacterium]